MGSLSKKKKRIVFDKYNGKCVYCNQELVKTANANDIYSDDIFHIDHINPKSRIGTDNRLKNLVPSCRKCNMNKRNMTPSEWREYLINKRLNLLDDISWIDSVVENINKRFK